MKKHLLFLSILILLVLFSFKDIILNKGYIYQGHDLAKQAVEKNELIRNYQENRFSLWNSYLASGIPAHSRMLPALSYPFSYIFASATLKNYINYMYIFHFIIMVIGVYILIIVFGLRPEAAFIGSVLFTFSKFSADRIHSGHFISICSFVWLPYVIIFSYKASRTLNKRLLIIYSGLTGLFISLQFLAGRPGLPYFSYIFSSLLNIFINLKSSEKYPDKFRKIILFNVITCLFVLGFTISQLIPTYLYTQFSSRNTADFFSYKKFNYAAPKLITYITTYFPKTFGFAPNLTFWGKLDYRGQYIFLVISTLPLLIIALKNRRKFPGLFTFLILISIGIVLLNLKEVSAITYYFWKCLPGFKWIYRDFYRSTYILYLLYAIIISYSIDFLWNNILIINKKLFLSILTISLISLFIIISGNKIIYEKGIKRIAQKKLIELKDKGRGRYHSLEYFNKKIEYFYYHTLVKDTVIRLSFFSLAVLFVLIYSLKRKKILIYFLMAVITFETLQFFNEFLIPIPISNYYKKTNLLTYLENNTKYERILPIGDAFINPKLFAIYKLFSSVDYGPVQLKYYQEYLNIAAKKEKETSTNSFPIMESYDLNKKYLEIAGIKYVIANRDIKIEADTPIIMNTETQKKIDYLDFQFLFKDNIRIYKLNNPVRFKFYDKIKYYNDNDEYYKSIKKYNLKENLLLMNNSVKPNPITEESLSFKINICEYKPGYINIKTSINKDAFFYISDVWYPNWKCKINGKKTQIYRAQYAFMAVPVKKGSSNIILYYSDSNYKIFIIISIILLLYLLYLIIIKYRELKYKGESRC